MEKRAEYACTMCNKANYYALYCIVTYRSRIVSCLIPLSPVMMLGIADAVVYRRMVGQVSCVASYSYLYCTGCTRTMLHYIVLYCTVLLLLQFSDVCCKAVIRVVCNALSIGHLDVVCWIKNTCFWYFRRRQQHCVFRPTLTICIHIHPIHPPLLLIITFYSSYPHIYVYFMLTQR